MGTRPRCGYCWRDHRGDRRASAVSVLRPVPERVKTGLYQLIPASKRPGFIEVAEDIAASIGRYIFGLFMLSLINGVLAAIFLTMIGAPSPTLLALIAFIGFAIPMVGTIASAIIITLVCLTASPETAVAAGIYYLIYMQIEAYVFTPRIMDTMVKISGSLDVVAVIAGAALGGIIGALVAVPMAASSMIITRRCHSPTKPPLTSHPEKRRTIRRNRFW